MTVQHDLTRGRDRIAQKIKEHGDPVPNGNPRPSSEEAHRRAAELARDADRLQREPRKEK